jgi:hypothetical protein
MISQFKLNCVPFYLEMGLPGIQIEIDYGFDSCSFKTSQIFMLQYH